MLCEGTYAGQARDLGHRLSSTPSQLCDVGQVTLPLCPSFLSWKMGILVSKDFVQSK